MAVFGATVTIQHSLFRDCHADLDGGSGGVIHAEESTIRMSNSAVVVASAGEGGALYLSGSSFVADANVTFTECSAQQWGGLAYMWQSHLQFSNNVSVTSCVALSGGGLAYLEQATMVAQQGVFIHDIMSASSGGMVFMVQSHMELSNGVEVHTLQAFEFGGMAYLVAGSTAIVRHNVSLLECYGWNSAGVVYVDVGCSFTAEDNVVISGCIGEANGGLAYVWQGHLELRRGIVIEQCSSQIGGGVLYLEEATANISSNVSITNCWSAWGGVFSVVYSHLKLSDGVEVVGASAADWGGVFQAVEGIVEARHSMRFIDPYASSGGALMNAFSSCLFILEGALVSGCYGEQWGGIAYIMADSQLHAVNVTFEHSYSGLPGNVYLDGSLMTAQDVLVRDVTARGSGGFVSSFSGALDLQHVTIERASALALQRSTRNEPWRWGSGGAVVLESHSLLTATNLTVSDCSAEGMGGFVYASGLWDESRVDLRGGVTVERCSARVGGAMYVESSSVLASGVEMRGCKATREGGAVYLHEAELLVQAGRVVDCGAGTHGGGIYAGPMSELTVLNSTLVGNEAAGGSGGAIHSASSTSKRVVVKESVLSGNSALQGGAVAAVSGAVLVDRSVLDGNYAGIEGGGVHVDGTATVQVQDSEILRCSADGGGGGAATRGQGRLEARGERVRMAANRATSGGGVLVNGAAFRVAAQELVNRKSVV